MRAAVLGAGSFGTCLAILLAQRGFQIDLWARDPHVADAIERHRRNPRYLTDFVLPRNVHATHSLELALRDKELVVSVVPSHAVREIWESAKSLLRPDALVVSASKGIEVGTGKLCSEVLMDVLPARMHDRLCFLSGPSFAREIAEHRPTAVTLAANNETYAVAAQALISSPEFRCYTNSDVIGVELGGALKNVIAIAVGVADGMESGLNSRAALITRGLAEMTRLGVAMGANPVTFLGLSGVGDLVLTCTGDLSRNRRVGIEIGRGRPVHEVLGGLTQVAEGVRTAKSAWELAQKLGVDMPITTGVYLMLFEGKNPFEAAVELRSRQLKSETE
ncbi:MAG TPA: NAD(P)H-dependent glycerol-3-phosphate dehydrogenase [Myxococcota bacterium]|nr:NAD(P)H-dependent glycerol-3-phosphate dehydrogenase [Myxococcota bacterium]